MVRSPIKVSSERAYLQGLECYAESFLKAWAKMEEASKGTPTHIEVRVILEVA